MCIPDTSRCIFVLLRAPSRVVLLWSGRFLVITMECTWNRRKLPVWNMEKSSSIPFHTMPWWLGLIIISDTIITVAYIVYGNTHKTRIREQKVSPHICSFTLGLLTSWSSGNYFASGAGGLRFKSWVGQIGRSVANSSPPLQHFFERSCVVRAQWCGLVEMDPENSLHSSAYYSEAYNERFDLIMILLQAYFIFGSD